MGKANTLGPNPLEEVDENMKEAISSTKEMGMGSLCSEMGAGMKANELMD